MIVCVLIVEADFLIFGEVGGKLSFLSACPSEWKSGGDDTYSSFSIEVTLSGDVYIKLGGSKYKVNVNSDNIPRSIESYGFKSVTLR